jgi:diguanylate cyclase (GGDEF)-like protein
MYEMTVRDPLTSLHNRRHLDERLKGEFAFAARHKTALTVFVIDVDHFKKVNDTYGHPAGDEVLRAMATVLLKMVRTEDVVARFGGEEFVVLARGIDDLGTEVFGQRLRAGVEALRVPWEGRELRLTVSIGVGHCDAMREYASPEALVAAADGALYRAKHGGRNQVVIADRE